MRESVSRRLYRDDNKNHLFCPIGNSTFILPLKGKACGREEKFEGRQVEEMVNNQVVPEAFFLPSAAASRRHSSSEE